MNDRLLIESDWERLDAGLPEERATFAAIGIRVNDVWLTEAEDLFVGNLRKKVHLSAYRLAEWLAWNWWRLRWEPFRPTVEWALAHKISAIGHGYIWPNVTIVSEGDRVILSPRPSELRRAEPLRYISRTPVFITPKEFEASVDDFVARVIERLRFCEISETNLCDVWRSVLEERSDPDIATYRRFEALLGFDVGDADGGLVERLIEDTRELGQNAVEELAATATPRYPPPSAHDLQSLARDVGIEIVRNDGADLTTRSRAELPVDVPAWQRGAAAANLLRAQEHIKSDHVTDDRLANLVGVRGDAFQDPSGQSPLTFELDEGVHGGTVVLRRRGRRGRRFDLARLLGDRLAASSLGRLHPVTNSSTYRQRLQRAFAAEFLCPLENLVDHVGNDYSDEKIEDAADHFDVSEQTVRLQLVNNHVASRDQVDLDRFDYRNFHLPYHLS